MNQTINNMAVHSTYEVRWKNFKGFEDTDWIKIKPITILIGANNSGKTSFLAPILLMNQTYLQEILLLH
jgi:AAA15 family ATPase/GTPase